MEDFYSNLIARAKEYAVRAHQRIGHRRKYTQFPYDVHLEHVARIVSSVTDDPETIAAAWLHDVVEDTPATLSDVEREFGKAVAELVDSLTDISRPGDGNRAKRKAMDMEHLARAGPRAMTVKLADIIDNAKDISKHDRAFARIYVNESESLMEVLQNGNPELYALARKTLQECSLKLEISLDSEDESGAIKERFVDRVPPRFVRLFMEAFSAEDLAEPPAPMRETNDEDFSKLNPRQLLNPEDSFSEVVHVLTIHDRAFVMNGKIIVGSISRGDLNKPVFRMWLFGIITLLEMEFLRLIEQIFPQGSWQKHLPVARLAKARDFRKERLRRNQSCRLIDCLQLSDKAQILLDAPGFLEIFGFESKRTAKRVISELVSLRNNLAHSQAIALQDWPQIARIASRLEEAQFRLRDG